MEKNINKDNLVTYIVDYETGLLSREEIVMLFQYLIDTGMAWQLQGSYGRMAQSFIENGICTKKIN